MLIEVRYRGIFWDNSQGGSGKPFEDRLHFNCNGNWSVEEVYHEAKNKLHKLESDEKFYGELKLISVELLNF